MTTQQPEAQQDFLAELEAISGALHRAHMRLSAALNSIGDGPDGSLPDGWHECYRAVQATHLAAQLVHVAIDSERERRAPVPFLPVEPAAQSHLRAILDEVLGDGS